MPTTEAGRALALAGVPMGQTREWFMDDIERVEAEARAEGYAAGLAAAQAVIDAARSILPESLNADLPSAITSDDPMVGGSAVRPSTGRPLATVLSNGQKTLTIVCPEGGVPSQPASTTTPDPTPAPTVTTTATAPTTPTPTVPPSSPAPTATSSAAATPTSTPSPTPTPSPSPSATPVPTPSATPTVAPTPPNTGTVSPPSSVKCDGTADTGAAL